MCIFQCSEGHFKRELYFKFLDSQRCERAGLLKPCSPCKCLKESAACTEVLRKKTRTFAVSRGCSREEYGNLRSVCPINVVLGTGVLLEPLLMPGAGSLGAVRAKER